MPVKWTADKDSFILNHLLIDTRIKIDNAVIDSMIETWPESFGDKPTRKAFTEHFSKVRKNNKNLTTSGASIPNTPSTTRVTKKTKTPASKTPSKRKKALITSDSDDEAADLDLGVAIKPEPEDDNESPSKKPRRAAVGNIKYEESEGEASHPSDGDDYVDPGIDAEI